MAELNQEHESHRMGMHTEQLAGRDQQVFFSAADGENFTYPYAFDVDFNKRAEFDAGDMSGEEVNLRIRELMAEGHGTIVVKNPGAKHGLGVGILNRLQLFGYRWLLSRCARVVACSHSTQCSFVAADWPGASSMLTIPNGIESPVERPFSTCLLYTSPSPRDS